MPRIRLTGSMTCAPHRAQQVRDALPDHISLTRAEAGCLRFDVVESAPGVFDVDELFTDRAAFDAHQERTKASAWATITADFPRDYKVQEL